MSDVAAPTASDSSSSVSTPPPPVSLTEDQILAGEGGLSPSDDAVPSSTPSASPTSTKPIVEGKGEAAGATPPTPTPAPADTPAASGLGEDIDRWLSDARLKHVPGETREQALLRLNTHYVGRADNHYNNLRRLKTEEIPALRQQVEQLRAIMEPMARREYERVVAAQREAAMAAIPDPETQPEQHNAYMLRLIAQQNAEREQREAWERQQQEQLATEEAQVDAVSEFDGQIIDDLNASLDADPALAADYALLSQAGFNSLQMDYPSDPPEKVKELLLLLQLNDWRTQVGSGRAVNDMIRQRAAMMRGLFASTATAATNGNANGHAATPAPTPTPAPTQAATAAPTTTGSATAARLAQETAAAKARSVVSPAPAARTAAPTGEGVKLADIPEEEFVELYLAGRITDDMVQAQVGKPRW